MATIGAGLYAEAAHEFFEGLRNYDAPRAAKVLAEDADLQSPWNDGVLTGRAAIQDLFAGILADPVARPSFTIRNISGDGHIVHLDISVSGRFGAKPQHYRLSLLHLQDQVHHIVFQPQ